MRGESTTRILSERGHGMTGGVSTPSKGHLSSGAESYARSMATHFAKNISQCSKYVLFTTDILNVGWRHLCSLYAVPLTKNCDPCWPEVKAFLHKHSIVWRQILLTANITSTNYVLQISKLIPSISLASGRMVLLLKLSRHVLFGEPRYSTAHFGHLNDKKCFLKTLHRWQQNTSNECRNLSKNRITQ